MYFAIGMLDGCKLSIEWPSAILCTVTRKTYKKQLDFFGISFVLQHHIKK